MKMRKIFGSIVLVMGLIAAAFGQSNKLQDLVGTNGSSGQNALEQRGYVLTHSDRSGGDSYSYWWSQNVKKCVVVRAKNNELKSIVDTEPFDCNQKADSGMSGGAKTAIGVGAAAAILGAIAIAHKAHQHEDGKHSADTNAEAEYERGYRDGLYNNAYHNYSNTKDYGQGYGVGVAQRGRETSHSTGRGGYRPHVNVADLEGTRASSGESEMESRGFRNVDGFKSGSTSYTIWWNGRTGQCIQVGTWDGRYGSVTDIETHPKCQ